MFSSDILEVRKAHNSYLVKFDIAIIFAKEANVNWINMKIMDVLKSSGLGRVKPILGKAVILSEEKAGGLTLVGKGFETISIDKDSHKEQIIDFLVKCER